jgi:hypothetical protein
MDVGLTTDPWQLNTAQRAVDQVGPADHTFLVRRDGSHFLIEGVKLVHRAKGGADGNRDPTCTESGHRVGLCLESRVCKGKRRFAQKVRALG